MQNFTGVIIEESLMDRSILDQLKIVSTKVRPVGEREQTPHVKQWTLHTVEISSEHADAFASELSKVLEGNNQTSYWYADCKNDQLVYIIFPNRVFKIYRDDPEGFQEARKYGITLGMPEHQVSFSPAW